MTPRLRLLALALLAASTTASCGVDDVNVQITVRDVPAGMSHLTYRISGEGIFPDVAGETSLVEAPIAQILVEDLPTGQDYQLHMEFYSNMDVGTPLCEYDQPFDAPLLEVVEVDTAWPCQ